MKPTQNVKRPVLKYTGSKWRIAPFVLKHFPAHRVYLEPFGGGGSILMRKPPAKLEIYNDRNGEIVNVFKQLRDNGDELKRRLGLTPWSRDEYYDAHRNPSDDPIERARQTIVKAWMGIKASGSTRKNPVGFGSGTWQRSVFFSWKTYLEALPSFTERLLAVEIENYPATTLIPRFDSPDTLIYCDPPYVPSTYSHAARVYGDYGMNDDDHVELLDLLMKAKGMVVISGYASELYDDTLKDWGRATIENLNVNNEKRTDVIWFNSAVKERLAQKELQLC